MSLRTVEHSKILRTLMLRAALPMAVLSLTFGGCIKRECICPGEGGVSDSAVPGAPLPKGTMLTAPQGTLSFELQGTKDKVNLAPVAADGQPFQQALRAE